MPVNWNDPTEVEQFKAAALQNGFDPMEVDSQIKNNTTKAAPTPEAPNPMVLPEMKTSAPPPLPTAPSIPSLPEMAKNIPIIKPPDQPAEQKPYDATGKTPEQVMAETGHQSEMDQMAKMPSVPQMATSQPMQQNQPNMGISQSGMQPQTQQATQLPPQGQATILGAKGRLGTVAGARQGADVFSGGINRGRDVAVPVGTPLAAPQGDWVVQQAYGADTRRGYVGNGSNQGYGNSVVLKNPDTGETIRMSHMSPGLAVKPGQTIKGGTVIGATGITGNTSGPHLDIEYTNPKGQLRDIMQSPYASYLM